VEEAAEEADVDEQESEESVSSGIYFLALECLLVFRDRKPVLSRRGGWIALNRSCADRRVRVSAPHS